MQGRGREKRKLRRKKNRKRIRRKKIQMRKKKIAKYCIFPMIYGSGGAKSRHAKVAGTGPDER
jgi:cell division protein FtsB